MPDDTSDLLPRLRTMATKITGWREQAQRLKATSRNSGAKYDDELLLEIEETSSGIYVGIAEFDALVADVDKTSHVAATQIVEVGDALRLLLMEITELGTQLYALRSSPPPRGQAIEVSEKDAAGPEPAASK